MNSTYQHEIIGILANKHEYFDVTVLKPEHLDPPFDYMFKAMQESHAKYGTVNFMDVTSDKKIASDLFIDCMTNIIHKDLPYFRSLEDTAIEEYKKKYFSQTVSKLLNKEIDVNQFYGMVDDTKGLSVVEPTKFDYSKIRDFMDRNPKRLIIPDYPYISEFGKFYENDLVFMSGKTGTGKTSFALNIMSSLAKTYPCVYINLEMSEYKITQRLIGMNTGIALDGLEQWRNLPQSKIELIKGYARKLNDENIEMHNTSQNLSSIRNIIGAHDQSKHFIVFIDHVGLVGSPGKGSTEKMSNAVKALRAMSLDFNCTIFALCQLNRDSNDSEKAPNLGMLKDSSEIEQTSRKVMILWTNDHTNYNLYFLKNDSGRTGVVKMVYDKECQIIKEGSARDVRT